MVALETWVGMCVGEGVGGGWIYEDVHMLKIRDVVLVQGGMTEYTTWAPILKIVQHVVVAVVLKLPIVAVAVVIRLNMWIICMHIIRNC